MARITPARAGITVNIHRPVYGRGLRSKPRKKGVIIGARAPPLLALFVGRLAGKVHLNFFGSTLSTAGKIISLGFSGLILAAAYRKSKI